MNAPRAHAQAAGPPDAAAPQPALPTPGARQRYVPQHFDAQGRYVPPHYEAAKRTPFRGYFAEDERKRAAEKERGYKLPAPELDPTPPPLPDKKIEGR